MSPIKKKILAPEAKFLMTFCRSATLQPFLCRCHLGPCPAPGGLRVWAPFSARENGHLRKALTLNLKCSHNQRISLKKVCTEKKEWASNESKKYIANGAVPG